MEANKKYVYYLDEIRRQKNMSVKNLCEGICSDRSYRRYLSGERELSQEYLLQFCDKLSMNINDFYYSFSKRDNLEYQRISKLYDFLGLRQYDELKKGLDQINPKYFTNAYNKKFYEYLYIRYFEGTKKLTKIQLHEKYADLVNYPNCINGSAFDFIDIMCIKRIAIIETQSKEKERDAMNLLYRVLKDEEIRYLTFDNRYLLCGLYADLATMIGKLGELEKSLSLAKEGIEYCISLQHMAGLPQLYYAASFVSHLMGNKHESYMYAAKALSGTISVQDKVFYNQFVYLFKHHYKVDEKTLLNYYFNNTK